MRCGGKAGKKKCTCTLYEMQWQSMEMKDIGLRFLAINWGFHKCRSPVIVTFLFYSCAMQV